MREITSQKSLLTPGRIVDKGRNYICMSSIDYNECDYLF
jgi:hypothetical protein